MSDEAFAGRANFLSHLSGDEAYNSFLFALPYFLSHLSGDEVTRPASILFSIFLSHLSGDEAI